MQEQLTDIIKSFKIRAECISYKKVRNISLYGVKLEPGERIQSLIKFSEEIALMLKSNGKLTFKSIPEDGLIQIESIDGPPHIINLLDELVKIKPPQNYSLPVFLGNSVNGDDIWTDFSKNPHMLIAGSTGSGKSVLIHTIITNLLLMSHSYVYMIDTKDLEFSSYTKKFKNISIYNSYDLACDIIEYLIEVMEYRFSLLRNSKYVLSDFQPLVIMIDEFADLIMQDSEDRLYNMICQLAQKCRAAGIYCVVATQRPSVDIIKGAIKANLSARIACKVASKTDSRVVLDKNGAELLSGNGDSIIKNYNHDYIRFQAAFTDPKEVLNVGK